MSENSPLSAIEAILPTGMTLPQLAVLLASGVAEAYAAYDNGANNTPSLSGYSSINEIKVFEADPSINPFAGAELTIDARSATPVETVKRVPIAYAGPTGSAEGPLGTPSPGSQLFGFTAAANDNSHNILILRGTVTLEEAGYDLLGWGNNTSCMLPSSSPTTSYGNVNKDLYDFYIKEDLGFVTSLAKSCLNAIQATAKANSNQNAPWFIGAHSLGGAMASLAALDAVVSGLLKQNNTGVITYGSLHVGDESWSTAYGQSGPPSLRVANLCDFVPSMVSLEPVTPTDPYIHVGYPGTFTWQTWDDWGNHSLANIYQPIVTSYWNLIQWGDQTYPQ